MTKLAKVTYCKECPAFESGEGRCTPFGAPICDVYVLGGTPSENIKHVDFTAFSEDSGLVYRSVMTSVKKLEPKFMALKLKMHHASHCYDANMNSKIVHHCSSLVTNEIYTSKAKTILCLGSEAMKALGIKGTVGEMRGQELFVTIGDRSIPVIVSFAPGALMRKDNVGKLQTAKHDIAMAFSMAAFGKRQRFTIEELTKQYVICKTPLEFKELVDKVLAQPADLPDGSEGPCENNLLAIDTETAVENNKYSAINTWVPGFKMIALSVSWAKGESGVVLLDHKLNPYPYSDYEEDIKRLLSSPNPKTFHNWKYDCKVLELAYPYYVNNVMFDSQMGEYLLDENKAGEYGLKKITKNRVPDFFGYENMLKGAVLATVDLVTKAKLRIAEIIVTGKDIVADAKVVRLRIKEINKQKKETSKKKSPEEFQEIITRKEHEDAILDGLKKKKAGLEEEKRALKEDIEGYKLILEGEKEMSFEDKPVDNMLLYAAIDTDITRQISKQQIAEIKADSAKLFKVLSTVMLPSARVLAEMEHVGVKVDLEYLEELRIHFEKVIEENKSKVFQKIGRVINLNSAKAIIDVLVVDYGIKLTKKTKSGQLSTDSAVMEVLAKEHDVARLILEYKQAYKARHTFLKGIMVGGKSKHDYGCSIDGRIHGNYNQTVAATGRLSSSAPNQQNIPLKILGMNIKKMLVPDDQETQVMVQVDISNAEVRVLTAYAPDKALIDVLNSGINIHSHVGSQVFANKGIYNTPGVGYSDLQDRDKLLESDPKEWERLDTMRQIAKMVVFLTIFGGGAYTLRSNLEKAGTKLSMEECEDIMALLLVKFPAIKTYMKTIKNTVNKFGEVSTFFGRKRRFPIARYSFKMKKAAYREAINSPIQGTSSDIVLHQMCELHEKFKELGFTKVFRGTVHDSIFFQFNKKDLHLLVPILDVYICDNVNKNFPWMPVKFEYDVEFGPSYGEAKTNLKKHEFSATA